MNYHFIAIGGAVMHNLALELKAHGHQVTGSDDEIFDPAKSRLQQAGLLPEAFGWFPERIHAGLDGIILGMHARADNPELLKARELGIQVYSFPEYIYEHSKSKTRVVIGGSHGKTTTTAMLMHVLKQCRIEFDYLVGSQLNGFDRMVKLSNAGIIVIEGDEYLTSALHPVPKFHVYHPHLALITGVAWDHINVFPTWENYVDQFRIFEQTLETDAALFWFEGDETLRELSAAFSHRNAPYREPSFEPYETGVLVNLPFGHFQLKIFGRHNLQNAAGAALLAAELGISAPDFWTAMQSFEGTARRMEKVLQTNDAVVYRDFAHSPSKVKATVQAIREQYPAHHMVAVFELHTYSSLRKDFMQGYHGALDMADAAFVLFDPHVFELKKMPVPTTEEIKSAFGTVVALSDPLELQQQVQLACQNKPLVLLLMSSGNLGGITDWLKS